MASNSSSIHPMPIPSPTRSPDSTAAVPTCLATCTGVRAGRMYTVVRNRSRSVIPARWAMVIHGSGHSVPISHRRPPSAV